MKRSGGVRTRREFTAASISALFAGMTVTLAGCGGGGGGGGSVAGPSTGSSSGAAAPTPTPASSADKTGNVSSNHGHTALIRGAQLQAGGAVTLDIQGLADHAHGLELTAEQVRQIAAGVRVSKSTARAGGEPGEYGSGGTADHDHTVTFNG